MASAFETIVDAIHEQLKDSRVCRGVYRKALTKNEGFFRIVWIPRGGRIEAATTGGFRADPNQISQTQRINPLAAKMLTVQAHIKARTFEELEILHNNLLVASSVGPLEKAIHPGAFEIISEGDERFGYLLGDNCGLVQEFTFNLVVVKQLQPLAALTAQAIDGTDADTFLSP